MPSTCTALGSVPTLPPPPLAIIITMVLEERAELVSCLPSKHTYLTPIPRTRVKKLDLVAHTCEGRET